VGSAEFYLGVDGGATKTIALVADADGRILGAGRGGCGSIYDPAGPPAALAVVEQAVRAALAAADIPAAHLAAGGFSMAGADWPEDFELLEQAMRTRGFGRTVIVVNDALGALWAVSPDGCGVSVVCGTSIGTGARAPTGRTWHAGFWQPDQAGGRALGEQTLAAVYQAERGLLPPTRLTGRVLAHYGETDVEALLHRFTRREGRAPKQADRLARLLLDTADEGDPVAVDLIDRTGAWLGDYALAAARRVEIVNSRFSLVLAGGVFRHPSPCLAEAVISRVHREAPGAGPIRSSREPVIGALLLALDAARRPITGSLRERLTDTQPPATFFET